MTVVRLRQAVAALTLATALLFELGAGLPTRSAAAQPPDPPMVGDTVVSDGLMDARIFASNTCPTNRGLSQNVGDGFILKIWGRCLPDRGDVDIPAPARGILLLDGDVAVDYKVVQGGARTGFNIYLRNRVGASLGASFNPTTGEASLFRLQSGSATMLWQRNDLAGYAYPDDWNRIGMRLSGNEVWLLLNEQTILYATGTPPEFGGMGLRVYREGSFDDNVEAAVVFRNLTVSSLVGGDESRQPTYQAP